jgi:hypothetical protein
VTNDSREQGIIRPAARVRLSTRPGNLCCSTPCAHDDVNRIDFTLISARASAGAQIMARVVVDDGKLVFLMGSLERLLTATGRYEVPIQNVVGVDTNHAQTFFSGAFTSGGGFGMGTGFKIPVLPFGGRFFTQDGRLLVAFRNPNKCITVSLKEEPYDRIIVQVEDKNRTADEIRRAAASPTPSD